MRNGFGQKRASSFHFRLAKQAADEMPPTRFKGIRQASATESRL
ncbi:hypothetical protein NMH_0322 [Neisseria meningitidis H44/76]|uniref:Uncharacterized protein n=1 Tax=Neisseria meningitidis serogroup B / serotype 15 (strain H44/76) TaxID=909420 RepID=E6MU80_NEIMH|nr:hypothetical protein NMH_0322 [Neisseria meningitidis H44/76]